MIKDSEWHAYVNLWNEKHYQSGDNWIRLNKQVTVTASDRHSKCQKDCKRIYKHYEYRTTNGYIRYVNLYLLTFTEICVFYNIQFLVTITSYSLSMEQPTVCSHGTIILLFTNKVCLALLNKETIKSDFNILKLQFIKIVC